MRCVLNRAGFLLDTPSSTWPRRNQYSALKTSTTSTSSVLPSPLAVDSIPDAPPVNSSGLSSKPLFSHSSHPPTLLPVPATSSARSYPPPSRATADLSSMPSPPLTARTSWCVSRLRPPPPLTRFIPVSQLLVLRPPDRRSPRTRTAL